MKRMVDIILDSKADWGVAVRNLTTGQSFEHQASKPFETVSISKLPILIVLLQEVQNGRLSLRTPIQIKPRHASLNGSGQLGILHHRLPFELYNLAVLMMTISDNVATNVIIELLGRTHINDTMRSWGLSHVVLQTDRFSFPSTYDVLNDRTGTGTAAELTELMSRLYTHKLLDAKHTKLALKILRHVATSNLLRLVPHGQVKTFGAKTGLIAMGPKDPVVIGECGFLTTVQHHTLMFTVIKCGPMDRRLMYSHDAKYRREIAEFGAAMIRDLG